MIHRRRIARILDALAAFFFADGAVRVAHLSQADIDDALDEWLRANG